ncbi:hypothetical protein RhiJN_24337 [Ceratobasidium sp. AG-Ba]|nr:hypothetical protein RhiJN_24337 [Ceratobasidium sp. AG-Ba]
MTFPSLRTFRAAGRAYADFYPLFGCYEYVPPPENALRRFFMRHPHLETISLCWLESDEYHGPIAPEDVESLFPSLVHAEAPPFFWVTIAASKLAEQIESMTLTDVFRWAYVGIDLKDIAKSARRMPKARRFKFNPRKLIDGDLDGLEDVLRLMPALETLEIGIKFETDKIASLLSSTPNLREAVIHIPCDGSERLDYILSMAKICPRLVSVHDAKYKDNVGRWVIIRTPGGDIKVAVEGD